MTDEASFNLTSLTAEIVSAYVGNNKTHADELAKLIAETYRALEGASEPARQAPPIERPDKAAIRKSLEGEHLTSFIDGRRYRSLARHLRNQGMSPSQYRETYGLPHDYPMVAPSYSAQRSALAKGQNFGRKLAQRPDGPGANAPAPEKHARGKAIKPQDETFT